MQLNEINLFYLLNFWESSNYSSSKWNNQTAIYGTLHHVRYCSHW